MNNFEEWLEKQFSINYTGTKDNYEDLRDIWFTDLGVQELIDYGQEFANDQYNKGGSDAMKKLDEVQLDLVEQKLLDNPF